MSPLLPPLCFPVLLPCRDASGLDSAGVHGSAGLHCGRPQPVRHARRPLAACLPGPAGGHRTDRPDRQPPGPAPLVALPDVSYQDIDQTALLDARSNLGGKREQAAIDLWIEAKTADLRAAEPARAAIRQRVEDEKKQPG